MVEKINNQDFIELNYTGKLLDGTVFDTTEEEVAKKNHLEGKDVRYKPAIICVGEQQILPGIDAQLVDKEIGKPYTLNLSAEEAFGKRDVKNMKIVPMSTFKENNLQPRPGLQINVDGEIGTVTRVSGGRVIVNFNHPLSGKEVVYEIKVLRKITDSKEKLVSFLNTTLKVPQDKINVEIKEEKAIVSLPMQLPPQFTEAVSGKLAELVKLKSVEFKQKSS